MENNYPKVSIIILNWNGLEFTIDCLESLRKITYPNYDVIVVDNGSTGNDVEVLKERYGDYIHIIENDSNYGFAQGNNMGIRYALRKGTDYILLLNNDTVVEEEFTTELVKVAESDSRIGSCQSKMLSSRDHKTIDGVGIRIKRTGYPYQIGRKEKDEGQYDTMCEVLGPCAAAALYKRGLFEQVGLFDEDFFAYGEDIDLACRARLGGWKCVYVPTAIVYHIGSATAGDRSPLKAYLSARNRYYFTTKNLPVKTLLLFLILRAAITPLFVLRSIKDGELNLIKPYLKGNFNGLKGLPKSLTKRKEIQKTKVVPGKYLLK